MIPSGELSASSQKWVACFSAYIKGRLMHLGRYRGFTFRFRRPKLASRGAGKPGEKAAEEHSVRSLLTQSHR